MPASCISRTSAAISAGSAVAGKFIRTHGRSAAGGLAKDAAVSCVTGVSLIHSDLSVATTFEFWARATTARTRSAGDSAVTTSDFFIRGVISSETLYHPGSHLSSLPSCAGLLRAGNSRPFRLAQRLRHTNQMKSTLDPGAVINRDQSRSVYELRGLRFNLTHYPNSAFNTLAG